MSTAGDVDSRQKLLYCGPNLRFGAKSRTQSRVDHWVESTDSSTKVYFYIYDIIVKKVQLVVRDCSTFRAQQACYKN